MFRIFKREPRAEVPLPTGPVRVVIFDFDGTLADTFRAGFEILNELAEEYGYRPLREEDIEGARDFSTRGLMRHLGVKARKLPAISRQGVKRLRTRIHSIQPLPGVPEMLRTLRDRGIRLGVVTSNSEENVGIFAKNHGLEVFEFVRSASRLMGKGREIRQVMRTQGFGIEDALYVGDETRDIEACRTVGMRCAAVTWGYNSRRALEEQVPYCLLDSPAELLTLIDSLTSPEKS